jgi:hypothetical protein
VPLDLTATVRTSPECETGSLLVSLQGWATCAEGEGRFACRRKAAQRAGNGAADEKDENGPVGIWVDARRRSAGALAAADTFLWIQVLDDLGAPLSDETYLGHGNDREYRVHARFAVEILLESNTSAGPGRNEIADGRLWSGAEAKFLQGLQARVLLRTYQTPSGPCYHTEQVVLPLLGPRHRQPIRDLLATSLPISDWLLESSGWDAARLMS